MVDKVERFVAFLNEDDGELLEKMIEDLSDKELTDFLEDNPEFLREI